MPTTAPHANIRCMRWIPFFEEAARGRRSGPEPQPEFRRQDFPAEVAVIEDRVIDPLIQGLQLGDRKLLRQQLEEDGVEGGFIP